MNELLNAYLYGQKLSIEGPFRAIVWLSSEVTLPRPVLKMLSGGTTEGNLPDVVNPREQSLVTNTRGPALHRDDQNFRLPIFKNSLFY